MKKTIRQGLSLFISFAAFLFAAVIPAFAQAISGDAGDDELLLDGVMEFTFEDEEYDPESDNSDVVLMKSRSSYTAGMYNSSLSYSCLSEQEKRIYEYMYEYALSIDNNANLDAIRTTNSSGNVTYRYNMGVLPEELYTDGDTLGKCYLALLLDNPQFFWIGHTLGRRTTGTKYSGFQFVLDNEDFKTGADRAAVKEALYAEIDRVIEGAKYYLNDYSKEYYVIKYITDKNTYNLQAKNAYCVVGTFLDGEAVCESYAESFHLLMNALGIPDNYVRGRSRTSGGQGSKHAWNQVMLGGEWYNLDLTWADKAELKTMWINTDDDSLIDTRSFTGSHVPDSTAGKGTEWYHGTFPCTSYRYGYQNHSINFAYMPDGAAASIGSVYYESLAGAVSAANSGDTITLFADNVSMDGINTAKDITIDGSGKTVILGSNTVSAKLTFRNAALFAGNNSAFTLTGSAGIIIGPGCVGTLPAINNGSLTILSNFSADSLTGFGKLTVGAQCILSAESLNVSDGIVLENGARLMVRNSITAKTITTAEGGCASIYLTENNAHADCEIISGDCNFYVRDSSFVLNTTEQASALCGGIYINGSASPAPFLETKTDTGYAYSADKSKCVSSVEISAAPVTEYKAGDEFDVTGGRIKVTYSFGETEELDITPDMISGFDPEKTGTQTVTVTCGGRSGTVEVTVEAVQRLTAQGGEKSVTLTWNAVNGAAKYAVKRVEGTSYAVVKANISASAVTYTVTGLAHGTEYTFVLQAYVNGKWTAISDVYTATARTNEQPASKLTAESTHNSVSLSWSGITGTAKYAVKRLDGTSYTVVNANISSAAASYTVTGLSADTEYTFVLQAYVSGKWTAISDEYKAVIRTAEAPASKLTAQETDTSVTISWAAVTGAAKYAVKRLDGTKYTVVNANISKTVASYTITGLTADTEYTFVLQAYVNGWTAITDEYKITVKTLESGVSLLTASGGNKSVTLTWEAIEGATKYAVKSVNGTAYAVVNANISKTATSYTVTGLNADTEYTYVLQAYVNGKWTAISDTYKATAKTNA